jgi:hypothetical protein
MTYNRDRETGSSPYKSRLCRIVMGEALPLWNIAWLKPELTDGFPQGSIVDQETLAKITPVITFRETRAYQ